MKKSSLTPVSSVVVVYKFISGLVELIIGLSIILFGKNISRIYTQYKLRELLEDPHDRLIITVQKMVPFFVHYRTYFIVTLVLFGIVKMIGALALFYHKEWGLDILILFFFLLLPFDIHTLFSHPTILKTLYFLINTLITLYLVEFQPHTHLQKYIRYLRKKDKD